MHQVYISCAIKLLRIYNHLSNRVERFKPIKDNEVKIFVCGPTVQDYMHLGHARTYIFFDVMRRYLSSLGFSVKLLLNVTDIDESVEREAGDRFDPFVEERVSSYMKDMEDLKIGRLHGFERVSRYVREMIAQISQLLDKGYAYTTDEAVFFDTSMVENFGELTHLPRKELELRPFELSMKKRNLLDFTLWRMYDSKTVVFSSPWGKGWPGWHIQDTAVAMSHFGPQYDVHGGAYDLIYPHHVAEIAQAEAITGIRPYVKYWVYTGFVKVKGEKMSKSGGNAVHVRDILERYGADRIRFYLLSVHYSRDLDYDPESLERKGNELEELRDRFARIDPEETSSSRRFYRMMMKQMDNNFDTRSAISLMVEAARNPDRFGLSPAEYRSVAARFSEIVGVDLVG